MDCDEFSHTLNSDIKENEDQIEELKLRVDKTKLNIELAQSALDETQDKLNQAKALIDELQETGSDIIESMISITDHFQEEIDRQKKNLAEEESLLDLNLNLIKFHEDLVEELHQQFSDQCLQHI